MAEVAPARSHRLPLLAIALAIALLHLLTNGRYGFHRDELQFLSDARHLDWGFVPYPPFTAFVEHIGLALFGRSLAGLRVFSVLAQSVAIYLAGRMAFHLGGGRQAQLAAALSAALAPVALFHGTEFQYTSFDHLWWVATAYFAVRLLTSGNPRWWLALGAAVGLGLMTKYTILFFSLALLAGFLLSPARRLLANRWFALALMITTLLCLPNLLWQIRHHFITLDFLRYIHARDIRWGRGEQFFSKQLWLNNNLYAVPLALAGLVAYLRRPQLRPLGWMYLLTLAFFALSRANYYYVAASYPMLIAMGAVAAERWLCELTRGRLAAQGIFYTGLILSGLYAISFVVPLASSGRMMHFALERNGDLREEFGWQEMVKTAASIRDQLPAQQQASLGILAGNYGEAGAFDLYGADYRLPPVLSLTNTAWLRGAPSPGPTTLIVIGFDRDELNQSFEGCRLAGHNGNSAGLVNEESKYHPDIFLCGPPRVGWQEFWLHHQRFG